MNCYIYSYWIVVKSIDHICVHASFVTSLHLTHWLLLYDLVFVIYSQPISQSVLYSQSFLA